MHDLAVIAGAQGSLQVASAATKERWEFRCVVVDQPASHRVTVFVDQLYRVTCDELTVDRNHTCR